MKRKIGYAVFLILLFAATKAQAQWSGGSCHLTLSMVDQTAATLHLTGAESFWATGVSYFDGVANHTAAINGTTLTLSGALSGTNETLSGLLIPQGGIVTPSNIVAATGTVTAASATFGVVHALASIGATGTISAGGQIDAASASLTGNLLVGTNMQADSATFTASIDIMGDLDVDNRITAASGTFSSALHTAALYSSDTLMLSGTSGYLMQAINTGNSGIYASATTNSIVAVASTTAIYGYTGGGGVGYGVFGDAVNLGWGVYGRADVDGYGVYAENTGSGKAFFALSASGQSIYAKTSINGDPSVTIWNQGSGNIVDYYGQGALKSQLTATGTLWLAGNVAASASIFATQGITVGNLQPVYALVTPGEATIASMNMVQTASATLAIGVDTLAITFSPAFPNTVYAVVCSCVVPAGAAPITCSPDTVTAAGFTANITTLHATACAMNAIAYGR